MKVISYLLIFGFINVLNPSRDTIFSVEQVAFEYFGNEILFDQYVDVKYVVFQSEVNDSLSKFTYGVCFEDYHSFDTLTENQLNALQKIQKEYSDEMLPELQALNIQNNQLFTQKRRKSKNKNAIFLELNRANIVLPDFSFVELIAYDNGGKSHYYFEIEMSTKSIKRWCKKRIVY